MCISWAGNQENCKKQVTFSFAFCDRCEHFVDRPGLGQIWTLKDALLNPQKYGVESKRNFTEFFQTRLTLSFNSGNPSDEIQSLFLKYYEESFPNTPIFVAEYHNPGNPHLGRDLVHMLKIAEKSSLLMGISFFEFQNRYDQAGHLIWGMFDPQKSSHQRQVKFEEISMDVPCLSPVFDHRSTIPEKLAHAYGGPGLAGLSEICMPEPEKVLVSKHGFKQMVGLGNITAMQHFIKRVVAKLGGFVPYVVPAEIAKMFMNPFSTYRDLEAMLVSHPQWARWDVFASCVADPEATDSQVSNKLSYICGLGYVDCGKVPSDCKGKLQDTASWVFGTHFREVVYSQDSTPKPLQNCYLDGAAQFVRSSIWKKSAVKHEPCVSSSLFCCVRYTFACHLYTVYPSIVLSMEIYGNFNLWSKPKYFHCFSFLIGGTIMEPSYVLQLTKDCIVPLGWTDPNKVHISQHGFHLVWSNQDPVAMMVFIARALEHTGGKLKSRVPDSFIQEMLVSRLNI